MIHNIAFLLSLDSLAYFLLQTLIQPPVLRTGNQHILHCFGRGGWFSQTLFTARSKPLNVGVRIRNVSNGIETSTKLAVEALSITGKSLPKEHDLASPRKSP